MQLGPLLSIHLDRLEHPASKLLDIVRVDAHAARPEGLRRPSEFREDEDAVVVVLARHVLVRDEVHAVTQRGDDAHLRRRAEIGQSWIASKASRQAGKKQSKKKARTHASKRAGTHAPRQAGSTYACTHARTHTAPA